MTSPKKFLKKIRDSLFGKEGPAKGFQPGEMEFDGIKLIVSREPAGWTMLRELVKAGAPIDVLRDIVLIGEAPTEGRHFRIAPGWNLARYEEDGGRTIRFKWRRTSP